MQVRKQLYGFPGLLFHQHVLHIFKRVAETKVCVPIAGLLAEKYDGRLCAEVELMSAEIW